MSTLKINNLQFGDNVVNENNFTLKLPAIPNGSLLLTRGTEQQPLDTLLSATDKGVFNFHNALTESVDVIGTDVIDLAKASVVKKTILAATTFTLVNLPPVGRVCCFVLDIINGGNYPVEWFAGVSWPGGTEPTLTTDGRDKLGFMSTDGGVSWDGLVFGKDIKDYSLTPVVIVPPALMYGASSRTWPWQVENRSGNYNTTWLEIQFTATGGTGVYTWTSTGGSPYSVVHQGNGKFRISPDKNVLRTTTFTVSDGSSSASINKSFQLWW